VELEGAGGTETVKESVPHVVVCVILLSHSPGDSARIKIQTLDLGSAKRE